MLHISLWINAVLCVALCALLFVSRIRVVLQIPVIISCVVCVAVLCLTLLVYDVV